MNSTAPKTNTAKLAYQILFAMIIGIVVGYAINQKWFVFETKYIKLLSDLFLRAIKMIIAPLVFSTLVVGIAQMGSGKEVGRVGLKALAWFVIASFGSLLLGLFFAHLLHPGVGAGLTLPAAGATTDALTKVLGSTKDTNFVDFVTNQIIPTSFVDASSGNKLLQIVFFSVFFGVALAALGPVGKPMVDLLEVLSHVMIKITTYVMKAAPIAVFAAMAYVVADKGLAVLWTYAKFMGSFYIALITLWIVLILVGYTFLGQRVVHLMGEIKEAFFLSFATASSEAAYPKLLDALDRFGVSRKISSFVMPLGYSFNLDGSMMYCTFASLFIAQLYGVNMSWGQQMAMLLTLMVTSKGMAGIPSASLVVIAGTLAQFGLPVEGMILIMAVDRFLDMGRSATNAVGNSIASAVIGKWEGQLLSTEDALARENAILKEANATMDHHL